MTLGIAFKMCEIKGNYNANNNYVFFMLVYSKKFDVAQDFD